MHRIQRLQANSNRIQNKVIAVNCFVWTNKHFSMRKKWAISRSPFDPHIVRAVFNNYKKNVALSFAFVHDDARFERWMPFINGTPCFFFHSLCARLAAQLIKSNKRIQENRTYHMESIPKPRKIIQQIILFVCCRVCIFCCLSICCHQLTEIKRSMIWNYAIIMSRLVKGLKFYAGFWFQFQCHSTIMHKLSSHTLRTHSITIGQRKFVC